MFKRKAKTFSGETVREGDVLCFINSDGEHCVNKLKYCNRTKRLYFWNDSFPITAYRSLQKCNHRPSMAESQTAHNKE